MKKIPLPIKNDFREVARQIIFIDRDARKYGRSQNTIGAIVSAMSAAYRLGQEHAARPVIAKITHGEALRWEDIPPFSRKLLDTILICASKNISSLTSILVKQSELNSPPRWIFVWDEGRERTKPDCSWSKKGVGPLIRLGLFAPTEPECGEILITDRGRATLLEAQRRYDARDPTMLLR